MPEGKRPSHWRRRSQEDVAKRVFEEQAALESLKKEFNQLFETSIGKELEAILLDAISVSQNAIRASRENHIKIVYHLGRWDLAEEILSLRHGIEIRGLLARVQEELEKKKVKTGT